MFIVYNISDGNYNKKSKFHSSSNCPQANDRIKKKKKLCKV